MTSREFVVQVGHSLIATSVLTVALVGVRPGALHANRTPPPRNAEATRKAEDILAKSRAAYAALKTYADSGTIVVEYGSAANPSKDVHTFRTYFRTPRLFYFDYLKGPTFGRLVIWSDEQAFHSWWQTTGNEDEYPKGHASSAFTLSESPTNGSINLISPLLFPRAGLSGTMTEFGDASDAGTESMGGRPCHKLVGVAKSVYRSGYVTNVRRTTVWIDVETLLIRQVFEDTARGVAAVNVSRKTTTLVPHANPALDDKHFQFTPPSLQK